MWPLDVNMDIHLLRVFSDMGMPCQSAIDRGWQKLANGQLIKAAAEAGFTCILTHDRLFAESASQTLILFPHLSIIIIRLPQRPWRDYISQFQTAWSKQPISPLPGAVVQWPAD